MPHQRHLKIYSLLQRPYFTTITIYSNTVYPRNPNASAAPPINTQYESRNTSKMSNISLSEYTLNDKKKVNNSTRNITTEYKLKN